VKGQKRELALIQKKHIFLTLCFSVLLFDEALLRRRLIDPRLLQALMFASKNSLDLIPVLKQNTRVIKE
jgi:hypothetical protein